MNVLRFWKQFFFFGIRLWEGEGGEGGGGGGGEKSFTKSELDSAVAAAVDQAVTGLKTKNSELLDNHKKLQEQIKAYGDYTPEKLKELINKFDNDEESKLLKDGKIDELMDRRFEKERAQYDEKINETIKSRDEYKGLYEGVVESNNRQKISDMFMREAIEAGVRKEAIEDVVSHAIDNFSVNADTGDIEARDKDGHLRKTEDGEKLLTPKLFIESLKTGKPHYWPDSNSAGAEGAGHGQGSSGDTSKKIAAAAAAGDMVAFRKLRQGKKDDNK